MSLRNSSCGVGFSPQRRLQPASSRAQETDGAAACSLGERKFREHA